MLYAEFYDGQGLGNQLWTYVSLRCLAEELGYDWTIFGSSRFKGKDFIELDGVDYDSVNESALGVPPGYMPDQCLYYIEQRKYHPYYLCDISDFDSGVLDVSDNTKIGSMMFRVENPLIPQPLWHADKGVLADG